MLSPFALVENSHSEWALATSSVLYTTMHSWVPNKSWKNVAQLFLLYEHWYSAIEAVCIHTLITCKLMFVTFCTDGSDSRDKPKLYRLQLSVTEVGTEKFDDNSIQVWEKK